MTKKEISILLNYTEEYCHKFFRDAAKQDNPVSKSIANKNNHSTRVMVIDYTLEECLYALSFSPNFTEMQEEFFKENFIKRNTLYKVNKLKRDKIPTDAQRFIFLYKRAKGMPAVCNTCAYLIPKAHNKAGVKERPFCNLYGVFIDKCSPKLNVYKDRCESYERTSSIPFLWLPDGPQNIDIFFNTTDKTIGVDRKDFISKRPKNEPVYLIGKN